MNTRKRLFYGLRKRVQAEFDSQQAVVDMEQQPAGAAVYDDVANETL